MRFHATLWGLLEDFTVKRLIWSSCTQNTLNRTQSKLSIGIKLSRIRFKLIELSSVKVAPPERNFSKGAAPGHMTWKDKMATNGAINLPPVAKNEKPMRNQRHFGAAKFELISFVFSVGWIESAANQGDFHIGNRIRSLDDRLFILGFENVADIICVWWTRKPTLATARNGSYGQVINGQHATSCYLSGRSD